MDRRDRFLQALNYCMLLPAPEPHQLAIYIGWLLHRTRGGIVAGTLFILPGLLCLGLLSWIYGRHNPGPVLRPEGRRLISRARSGRVGKRASKSKAMVAVADVAAMVNLSKRTLSNIRQNITIALGLKGVFLVTTIAGLT